jgi:hypothetical protein
MRRYLLALFAVIAAFAGVPAPPAGAFDAPIGRLGDTLRVNYDDPVYGKITADVTVHDVLPSPVPPGWGWNGSPRGPGGGPWRAAVTVHPVQVPNPHVLALAFTFDGVTPYDDAYVAKHTDAPDALESALLNAPQGSTVDGGVYWDVYRELVTDVVLLNPKTGLHLAQWNMWYPGTPLP